MIAIPIKMKILWIDFCEFSSIEGNVFENFNFCFDFGVDYSRVNSSAVEL